MATFGTSDNCEFLGDYVECACTGIMACSTCHMAVRPDWYDAAGVPAHGLKARPGNKATEAERDMLDPAYEPRATSRLGCRIELTLESDGPAILLPRWSRNLTNHVPFG